MKYYDYEWDLHPDKIIIDPDIDIDKLGWKGGDYFKLVNINGQVQLVKLDPLMKFLKDGESKWANTEIGTTAYQNIQKFIFLINRFGMIKI